MTSMGWEKMTKMLPQSAAPVTIGIDISKHTLDTHLYPQGLTQQFSNDPEGHRKLIAWAACKQPDHIIFEATGAYHRALEMALGKAGLPAVKINPLQARRFSEATGKRAKTDPVDAAMLARFGAALPPDIPRARDETIDRLAELFAARRALVKDKTAILNRHQGLTLALLKRQCDQRLKQIEADIDAIDKECKSILTANKTLKTRFDILLSVPGLGLVTALALLIDMPELGTPELGTMDAKQAASLAGLAPVTRQSGTWRGKSVIQGGRAPLRQAIYMPALVALRFNPPLKQKYEALRKAGKPAKVAIVAIMRKIIVLANALLKNGKTWVEKTA
jgi:transposase